MTGTRKAVTTGVVLAVALLGVGGWAAYQATTQRPELPMARLMPQGAALFLEAKDFAVLLREWNASPEKQAWLKSDNYEVFSRSRLFLRLEQVQGEFAAAAGLPPNMSFLTEVAGERSALGIYDIGKLELLYVTRLPSARVAQSTLWQKRAQFEPRQASGQQFFVRSEPQSGRLVAFALAGDYLLLATREDLMAGALTLLSGQKLGSLAEDGWFATAVKAGKEPGDLRMLINLAKVSHTPQFRTYWIQRNITDMQQYEAVLTDLYRSSAEYREERVLFRLPSADASAKSCGADNDDGARAVADLLRFAPGESGMYRATTPVSVETVASSLEQKLLTPRFWIVPPSKLAPSVSLGDGAVGSESDLETRIDAAPAARTGAAPAIEVLKAVLSKASVRAMLQLHRSEVAADGVFVKLRSTIVLSAGSDWDDSAVRSALQESAAPGLTTSELGAAWKQAGSGAEAHFELDGLAELLVAVRGKYLFVGNDLAMMNGALRRMSERAAAEPACYAAGFNHGRQRQDFYRLSSLVDQPNRPTGSAGSPREPDFFSGNVASLSQVLAGVESQSIIIRSTGAQEVQSVRYRWSR